MDGKYDVVVIGGGTAGTVAAIQAGRAGAKTLLLEKNGMLGGTLTVAGVNAPALFFAWGKQVIAGIGWELVTRTLEETDRCPPDFSDPTAPHWKHHTHVDRGIYAALCDEAVVSAGVDLVFHAMPATVEFEQGTWSVQVCTKSGLERVSARVLIDCSGDANAVTLAGYPVQRPEPVQPGTLTMHCDGYDFDALDLETIDAAVEKAVAEGRLRYTDVGWRKDGAGPFLRSHGHNSNHVTTVAADTSDGRTRAEIEARRSMLRMYRFFRSQPGLEEFRIDHVASECGIRESVVIEGKARITGDDYVAGRFFDDAVCYCFYPVDIHLDDGEGIDYRRLTPGTLPTIPRGAMLPAGSEFLIVAGRCIAGDRVAHSAYRVEAPCMAMGQAAGAMAALSARSGVDPQELALDEVYALLRRDGAIVPGDVQI